MVKRRLQLLLSIIGLAALVIVVPRVCGAFETMTWNDGEQQLQIYGFIRNQTGIFLHNQPLSGTDDKLAMETTWLRTYVDAKLSDKIKFWGAIQFAYAPPYKIESKFSYPSMDSSGQGGHNDFYCQYNNVNDVLREAYIQWDPDKKNEFKIGRQIAIWGEAMTDRVGDVVQPETQRYGMSLANLEDSRIPQWMVRFFHNFGILNTSAEFIVQPLLTEPDYRVNQVSQYANTEPGSAGQVWGNYPENRWLPPLSFSTANPPFSRDFVYVPNLGWKQTAIPTVSEKYPDGIEDTRGGFRTSTEYKGYTFGAMYFHTQEYNPIYSRGGLTGVMIPVTSTISLPQRQYYLTYPTKDIIGVYFNKQLPWPGVIRAEGIYVPNQPFNTFDTTDSDAVVRRDYFKYMVAYDLNDYLYFQWHNTAPFNVTLEHVGEFTPDNKDLQYMIYATEVPSFIPRFNMNVSTNWFYNRLGTQVIFSYFPWSNSGLVMPSVTWTPGWRNNKFSMSLQYIQIYGDSYYEALGFLKSKSCFMLTTQLNF